MLLDNTDGIFSEIYYRCYKYSETDVNGGKAQYGFYRGDKDTEASVSYITLCVEVKILKDKVIKKRYERKYSDGEPEEVFVHIRFRKGWFSHIDLHSAAPWTAA